MTAARNIRWLILIFLQAATVAWAYTAITHLLATSPTQQQQLAEYHSTSQPVSAAMVRINQEQTQWGRQSLFSVASCFLVLMFVMINWVLDGRPPRDGDFR
jgi:NADH:ubiquinone oxidoreductase subunit 3 (subunit A)